MNTTVIQLTEPQSHRLRLLAEESGLPPDKIAAVLMDWLFCNPDAGELWEYAKQAASEDQEPPAWFRG